MFNVDFVCKVNGYFSIKQNFYHCNMDKFNLLHKKKKCLSTYQHPIIIIFKELYRNKIIMIILRLINGTNMEEKRDSF